MASVVVVDNDNAVLDLVTLDLGLEGHDIQATAVDAAAAVAAVEQHRPDVLVVDLRLGRGPNGLDVARQVRREGLRIVLHTNYVNAGVVREAASLGVIVVEKGSLLALRRAVAPDVLRGQFLATAQVGDQQEQRDRGGGRQE